MSREKFNIIKEEADYLTTLNKDFLHKDNEFDSVIIRKNHDHKVIGIIGPNLQKEGGVSDFIDFCLDFCIFVLIN